ncbi:MAG: hypothetical protein HWE30_09140 [Methylocystaceae bacterium]|nr:hypothetical protein [Methylocystaceae bacterium]
MLFDTFKDQELIWQSNVSGDTSCGKYAFRGDLAITLGDMHEASNTRNQPKCILESANILADAEQFIFVSGSLLSLDDIPAFVERYGQYIADDVKVMLYVVDTSKPMFIEYEGKQLYINTYEDSTVWQLLMEDLYVEKSDMKGQSPQDKLVTMYEACKDFKPKYDTVSYDDALGFKIEGAKRAIHGAV